MLELRREGFRRCAIERQERKGKKHLNFCGNLKERRIKSIECYSTSRRHDTRSGGYVYGGVKFKASASWLIALGLGCRASGSSFRRCKKLRLHTPHFMRIMSNNHPGVRQPKPHVPHVHPGEKTSLQSAVRVRIMSARSVQSFGTQQLGISLVQGRANAFQWPHHLPCIGPCGSVLLVCCKDILNIFISFIKMR